MRGLVSSRLYVLRTKAYIHSLIWPINVTIQGLNFLVDLNNTNQIKFNEHKIRQSIYDCILPVVQLNLQYKASPLTPM